MAGIGSATGTPTSRAGSRRGWLTRSRLIRIGIIGMATLVVILLILIGLGILVLPSKPIEVTITAVQWHISQGTSEDGYGWFGPSWVNETDADGLPATFASGSSFTEVIVLPTSGNHTLYSAAVQSPFRLTACAPALPTTPVGVDDFHFTATLAVPSVSSDTSYAVFLTLNALVPSSVPCAS